MTNASFRKPVKENQNRKQIKKQDGTRIAALEARRSNGSSCFFVEIDETIRGKQGAAGEQ